MIVCVCKNINQKQIQSMLSQNKSMDEIQMETCAGLNCGQCLKLLEEMTKTENKKNNQ